VLKIDTPKPSLPKEKNNASREDDIRSILSQLDQFGFPSEENKKEKQQPPQPTELFSEAPDPNEEESAEEYETPHLQPVHQQVRPQPVSSGQMQEIVEAIVEEKWQQFTNQFGDLGLWKEKVERDLISIKQEVLRTQDRFMQLQKAVMGKVSEYNDNISNVHTEMKALEKVFEKIIEPLTTNIKELKKITERLKK